MKVEKKYIVQQGLNPDLQDTKRIHANVILFVQKVYTFSIILKYLEQKKIMKMQNIL